MKNTSNEILFSQIFDKWPVLKKSYNHCKGLNNDLDLFVEYKLKDQNGEILLYPVGIYDDKLVFITKDDKLNFPFDQISLKYALKHMQRIEPINRLSVEQLSKYYIRLFSLIKAIYFFDNKEFKQN